MANNGNGGSSSGNNARFGTDYREDYISLLEEQKGWMTERNQRLESEARERNLNKPSLAKRLEDAGVFQLGQQLAKLEARSIGVLELSLAEDEASKKRAVDKLREAGHTVILQRNELRFYGSFQATEAVRVLEGLGVQCSAKMVVPLISTRVGREDCTSDYLSFGYYNLHKRTAGM
ncbi:hypothetical protein Tsubulata_050849 [Turnera subulata]|uniref:Uncharacterized protein n=1 Tax=Turnera subulata TaxID=218843 RepID=A0A9Q0G4W2_9ROSI|nr:hypothetical protein Tsubulata_050849 [Turnera subulata]